MEINLQELNYKDKIDIDNNIEMPNELLENTEIVKMDKVNVLGNIKYSLDDTYQINLDVSGVMYLNDAITSEVVPYNFTINIEENLENSCKTLDLIEFLWHYIVLEIPLRYTLSDESLKIETDSYKVISEEEYKNNNNPFKDFFKE